MRKFETLHETYIFSSAHILFSLNGQIRSLALRKKIPLFTGDCLLFRMKIRLTQLDVKLDPRMKVKLMCDFHFRED